jgi:hypothetical protein
MRILPVLLTAVLLSFLGHLGASSAQAEDPKKAAKKLATQGDERFREGEYEIALEKYQKSYETYANPKVFFPMAQSEEMLGRDLEALQHYEQFLSEAGDGAGEQVRKDAQSRITEIESRISIVTFAVRPEGTVVSIDDVEMGEAPLDEPVKLLPGKHTYGFKKEGFASLTKTVELQPGDRVQEAVELGPQRPVAAKTGSRKQAPKGTPAPSSTSHERWFYGGLATTGTLGAAALVTGILAVSKHNTYTDQTLPLDDRVDARATGETLALTTDILLAGTVAAGAFTAYWYFFEMRPAAASGERAPAVAGASWVAPWATADGGGLVVAGSF